MKSFKSYTCDQCLEATNHRTFVDIGQAIDVKTGKPNTKSFYCCEECCKLLLTNLPTPEEKKMANLSFDVYRYFVECWDKLSGSWALFAFCLDEGSARREFMDIKHTENAPPTRIRLGFREVDLYWNEAKDGKRPQNSLTPNPFLVQMPYLPWRF